MPNYQSIYYESSDGLTLHARDYPHDNPRATLLCMHGLSRNAADFSALCDILHTDYRIIAVDQRGRGLSEYDSNPDNYSVPVYVRDMFTLLAQLGLEDVVAIGTSMGGVISMAMAATRPGCFTAVVLNDIGPEIDSAGLDRIRGYVGQLPPVTTWAEAAAQARSRNEIAFPDYTDDDWLRFAKNIYVENKDGHPVPAYDPEIARSLQQNNAVVDMWPLFDTMKTCPVLAVRGATSDILSPSCVDGMRERHPDFTAVEIPDRGHAPMLDEPAAVAAIQTFLGGLS